MKIIHTQADAKTIRDAFQKSFFSRKKQIVKVEENYLPCYLFKLRFKSLKKTKNIFVICDGLAGKVRRIDWPQPYRFSPLNLNNFSLDEAAALKKVKEELRWFSFSSGLRIKKKYHLEEVAVLGKVGYPFWLVYFKRKGKYNFSVYDALSGKKEDFFGKDIFLSHFGLGKIKVD